MKKIMFFAHDPGGANAIAPLISEFEKVLIFGKGPTLRILKNSTELPENAFTEYKPDFLITGTSANDFTERELWGEAEKLGIPSMAILDSWVNYGIRFSDYGTDKLHLFDKTCNRLPEYICVPDETAKDDMIKDGVPEALILAFGNPHFEETARCAKKTKMPNTSDGKIILFASQPFDDIYYKGSEEIALSDLIEIAKIYDDTTVLIRKHPKESAEKFEKYLCNRVFMDNNDDVYDSIRQSEMVVSVNSMVLIEALFFGKKIISYQPKNKNGKNDFILTRNNTLPYIDNFDKFKDYFDELYNIRNYIIETDIIHTGIINRIKTFVEEIINGDTCD